MLGKIKPIDLLSMVLCVLLMAPILIVVVVSFGKSSFMIFPPSSFSLRWYDDFFSSSDWMDSLGMSLVIGLISSVISTTLGFLGAYSLVRGKYRNKKLLVSFCLLPIIVPSIITAVAFYFISAPLGLVGARPWIAICHSTLSVPIVLLILLGSLQNVDESIERAACGLGASKLYTFTRVVIPMVAPGILSAAFFSFLASFDELIIALFLSGISNQTLPVRIWNSLLMDMQPVIAAISAFLILVTIVLLLLQLAARRLRT